jgi:hypothetical protein
MGEGSRDGLEGELPVQPSSSTEQPLASMTPTAEPIPPNELPAASPCQTRGNAAAREAGGRSPFC